MKGTSFFVVHGVQDQVIPVTFARRARILLEQAAIEMEYHEYPMAHQISDESLRDMIVWIKKLM